MAEKTFTNINVLKSGYTGECKNVSNHHSTHTYISAILIPSQQVLTLWVSIGLEVSRWVAYPEVSRQVTCLEVSR